MTVMIRTLLGAVVWLVFAGAAVAGDTSPIATHDAAAGPFEKAACYVFGGREDCRTVRIFDADECIVKIHPQPLPDLDPSELACLRDEIQTRKLYLRNASLLDAVASNQINVVGEEVVEVLVGYDDNGAEVWESRDADAFELKGDPLRTRETIGKLSSEFCAGPSRMVGGGTSGGTIAAEEAFRRAAEGSIILIDIRLPSEWRRTGVGVNAIPITKHQSIYHFVDQLKTVDGINDRPIALICAEGVRSANMQDMLMQFGFKGVIDVHEGMEGNAEGPGWIKSGLPVTPYNPEQAVLIR
jgi:rhodanese-related sulfurtransferase